jgi:methionyl aminopeptidase
MSGIGGLTPADVDGAYSAAQKVVEVHRALVGHLRPGMTMAQIDQFVGKTLEALGCQSCFYGYRQSLRTPKFPSFACLSVNDCVVHGTAGSYLKPLVPGDLLKVDVGVSYRGWIGDAAWTYSIGTPAPVIRKLMDAGKESLRLGIAELRPGQRLREWARAVQDCVERKYGFHLVRGLGGHGYGRRLHEAPFVSNYLPTYKGEWQDGDLTCAPGMLLALEPMISLGTSSQRQDGRSTWPVYTADGSMSSHHEHDVLITETGPRVLTEGLDDLRDEIAV